MKILIQKFKERDGDYVPGSVRIAVVTEEPTGRCAICKCLLYASTAWEPSGTMVLCNDFGKHKKRCENRPKTPVTMRTITG